MVTKDVFQKVSRRIIEGVETENDSYSAKELAQLLKNLDYTTVTVVYDGDNFVITAEKEPQS